MPRGRPRKSSGEPPSTNKALDRTAVHNNTAEPASAGRPARNRIAVRKFGAVSDQDDMDGKSLSSSSKHEDPMQKPAPGQPGGGYVLIHKSLWTDVCSSLSCSSCGKRSVKMKTEKLSGLAYRLIMYCSLCGVVLSQVTTSAKPDEDPDPEEEVDYEVNRKFMKFFVNEGKTYDDVVTFSKTLGIPIISKSLFEKYRNELLPSDVQNVHDVRTSTS